MDLLPRLDTVYYVLNIPPKQPVQNRKDISKTFKDNIMQTSIFSDHWNLNFSWKVVPQTKFICRRLFDYLVCSNRRTIMAANIRGCLMIFRGHLNLSPILCRHHGIFRTSGYPKSSRIRPGLRPMVTWGTSMLGNLLTGWHLTSEDIPPMRVMFYHGKFHSIDNRRLQLGDKCWEESVSFSLRPSRTRVYKVLCHYLVISCNFTICTIIDVG